MAAPTNYYVDPAGGNDTTGNGTIGTPWKTVQKALNTIVKNTTDGDQINVKAGTADVLSAQLSFATYGNASNTAPLIIRGYTATANDGGQGVISGGGLVSVVGTSVSNHSYFTDLKCYNCGANPVIGYNSASWSSFFYQCEFSDATIGIRTRGSWARRCHFHDLTTSGWQASVSTFYCLDNFFENCTNWCIDSTGGDPAVIIGNIFKCSGTQSGIFLWSSNNFGYLIDRNTFWSNGGTGTGITFRSSDYASMITNNIFAGFSGAGGKGIVAANTGANVGLYADNYFYNNTTHVSIAGDIFLVLGGDTILAANPFVDPANDDFRIGSEAKSGGWPSSFLGSNTNQYLDPGAAQRQEVGGGSIWGAIVR